MRIQDLQIEGNSLVENNQLEAIVESKLSGKYWKLFSRRNAVLYPKEEIEKAVLAEFLPITKTVVSLLHFKTLFLQVTERKPFGLFCGPSILEKGPCYYLDSEGFVFFKAPSFSEDVLPTFYGTLPLVGDPLAQKFLPPNLFQKSVSFREKIENMGFVPAYIFKKDEGTLELYLKNGSKIIFDPRIETEKILQNFSALLRDSSLGLQKTRGEFSVSYIDLRFGNKVFYK